MKNIKLLSLLILAILVSCSPEFDEVKNINEISKEQIKSIEIKPDYKVLIANGKNKLKFHIFAYGVSKEGKSYQIPEDRLKPEWFTYKTSKGVVKDGEFSTSDASLVGQTIEVSTEVKGLDIESNTVSFTITSPLKPEFKEPITVPVVFHVIQTKEEVEEYANNYDKEVFYKALDKVNAVFQRKLSDAASAVNTNITFKPAIYGSNGLKLREEGINRVIVENIPQVPLYSTIIESEGLMWDPQKYLNIWIISDFSDNNAKFILPTFLGQYMPMTFELGGVAPIAGLPLRPYDASVPFDIQQSGILFNLQSLSSPIKRYDSKFGYEFVNELVFYIGKYYGLLPTYGDKRDKKGYDFCEDTHDNEPNNDTFKEVEGYYFLSENIMDDASGMHTFISKEQAERVRWVLENCPERASWKSKFAFTGK